mgnify:CR=1 FL=1|jgi:hypothetical protein
MTIWEQIGKLERSQRRKRKKKEMEKEMRRKSEKKKICDKNMKLAPRETQIKLRN